MLTLSMPHQFGYTLYCGQLYITHSTPHGQDYKYFWSDFLQGGEGSPCPPQEPEQGGQRPPKFWYNIIQYNAMQCNTIQYNKIQYRRTDVSKSFRHWHFLFVFIMTNCLVNGCTVGCSKNEICRHRHPKG